MKLEQGETATSQVDTDNPCLHWEHLVSSLRVAFDITEPDPTSIPFSIWKVEDNFVPHVIWTPRSMTQGWGALAQD